MALVTIDDRITRVGAKSVTLQVVERVDRDVFYTSDSSNALRHDQEGVTWIRGHYVPDSAEVRAAQAALALAVEPQQGLQLSHGILATGMRARIQQEMIAPSGLWPRDNKKTTLGG